MVFNNHKNLEGLHAPFGASKYAWLRYDDNKVLDVYTNLKAAEYGTRLHAWAKETIDLKIKQPRSTKTIYSYVNDAIGFNMNTEVVLFYSPYFFGTADSISFKKNFLRIHDLKSGKIPANMEQLFIYVALFCLEYKIKPAEIQIECRIYQNDDILIANPTVEDIVPIMDKIVHINNLLENVEGRI
jgi:hypothetical protein